MFVNEEMNTYIIAFKVIGDDVKINRKWKEAINDYPAWAQLNENTYLFVSSDEIETVTEHFGGAILKESSCFIAKITDDTAWGGFPKEVMLWIEEKTKKNN